MLCISITGHVQLWQFCLWKKLCKASWCQAARTALLLQENQVFQIFSTAFPCVSSFCEQSMQAKGTCTFHLSAVVYLKKGTQVSVYVCREENTSSRQERTVGRSPRQDKTVETSLRHILVRSFCLLELHLWHRSTQGCGLRKGLQKPSKFQRHEIGIVLHVQSQLNEANI